ncbi:MAG: hypothetical protein NXH97_08545 [Rhodobacteraceae bacterium]|nr:hypothetical protein [Paracoccaceae bacterium]
MILRVFQVTTQPGKAADFAAFFHDTAVPLMLSVDGLLAVLPGAARHETPDAFAFVMLWRDLDALKAFVGEDYASPHIHADEAALVAARSITHYDLVEEGAKGLALGA